MSVKLSIAALVATALMAIITAQLRGWRRYALWALAAVIFVSGLVQVWQASKRTPEALEQAMLTKIQDRDWDRLEALTTKSKGIAELENLRRYAMGLVASSPLHLLRDPTPLFNAIDPSSPYFLKGQRRLVQYIHDRYSENPDTFKGMLHNVVKTLQASGIDSGLESFLRIATIGEPYTYALVSKECARLREAHQHYFDFEEMRYKIELAYLPKEGGLLLNFDFSELAEHADIYNLLAAVLLCQDLSLTVADRERLPEVRKEAMLAIERLASRFPEHAVRRGFIAHESMFYSALRNYAAHRPDETFEWPRGDTFEISLSLRTLPYRGWKAGDPVVTDEGKAAWPVERLGEASGEE